MLVLSSKKQGIGDFRDKEDDAIYIRNFGSIDAYRVCGSVR